MTALSPFLTELLERCTEALSEVTRKRMFGSNAFFGHGKIFALEWDDRIAVKLSDAADFAALAREPGARPWSPAGAKAMSHWLLVPESLLDDEEALSEWLKRAHLQARAKVAPPKVAGVSQAAAEIKRRGLLTLSPQLVELIAGEKVKGSWWSHPSGNAIYAVAEGLEQRSDLAVVKLIDGKITFVHRALWPALLRVVTDARWRATRAKMLSTKARTLLGEVEKEKLKRLVRALPARVELEKELLVFSASEHSEAGNHQIVLQSWQSWAAKRKVKAAKQSLGAALSRLRAAGATI